MFNWLRAGVVAGCLALTAAAVDWKAQRPEGCVTDLARVIDAVSRAQINRYCAAVEQATPAKLALVVVGSLQREPAADVARALFDGWNLGDRGVLVLLAESERRYAIQLGHDLDPQIAAHIVSEMRPALRAANYSEALMAAAETAGTSLGPRGLRLKVSLPRQMRPSALEGKWWIFGAGAVVITGMAVLLWRSPRRSGFSRARIAGGFGGFDSSDGCGAFGGASRHTHASDW